MIYQSPPTQSLLQTQGLDASPISDHCILCIADRSVSGVSGELIGLFGRMVGNNRDEDVQHDYHNVPVSKECGEITRVIGVHETGDGNESIE